MSLESGKYLMMYVQFWAPDDEQKNRLKYVERLTEINKLRNVTLFWLYSANILAMHRTMNVKFIQILFHLSYLLRIFPFYMSDKEKI